jgi:putative endonuclease
MMDLLYRWADRLRDRARTKSAPVNTAHGSRGEDLAHRLLRAQGFTIVARNYRPPSGNGEIDLVAWDGPTLAFVEVKTRSREDFGAPEAAVDEEKRRFLYRAARDYARRAGVEWEQTRFDVVSIVLTDPPKVELMKDAFRPQWMSRPGLR